MNAARERSEQAATATGAVSYNSSLGGAVMTRKHHVPGFAGCASESVCPGERGWVHPIGNRVELQADHLCVDARTARIADLEDVFCGNTPCLVIA